MGEYDKLQSEYGSISVEIDEAIELNKPFHEFFELSEKLFRCIDRMEETPEAKAWWDRHFSEMAEMAKIIRSFEVPAETAQQLFADYEITSCY